MDPELVRLGLKDGQLIVPMGMDAIEEIQVDKDNDSLEPGRWISHLSICREGVVCVTSNVDHEIAGRAAHQGQTRQSCGST